MKKIVIVFIVFTCMACSSQSKKEVKLENNLKTVKLEKKVYEKEVLNLKVDNSVPEKLTFNWELPEENSETEEIQILRRYLNDGNPDQAFKKIRIKNLEKNSTSITIDEYGLMNAMYKVKLISKDKKRSEGLEIEAFTKHPNVVSEIFEGKEMAVYLPNGYEKSNKEYPVMYMWDGQKLFTEGHGTTWEIDECLNKLSKDGFVEEMIVVGIFNAGKGRRIEYFPFQIPELWIGEGDKHAKFLAEKIVPYIDEKYKTIKNRENRGIMGSSMGGLMSMYTITAYSDIFSMAGVLSPWFPDQLLEYVKNMPKTKNTKIWIDAGTDESSMNFGHYALNARKLVETMLEKGYSYENDFMYYEVDGGIHHEMAWAKRVNNPFILFKGLKEAKSFDIELIDEQFIGNEELKRYLNVLVKNENTFLHSAYKKAKYRSIDGKIEIDETGAYKFLDENGGEVEVEYNGIKKRINLVKKK